VSNLSRSTGLPEDSRLVAPAGRLVTPFYIIPVMLPMGNSFTG
jgi:hypothetical protein